MDKIVLLYFVSNKFGRKNK